jgi:hypothetical protein
LGEVTWSNVSSKGFAGRLSPGGFIHDVSGMTCFPEESNLLEVLSVFNSTIAKYLLSALNPTIHYQVGDIERLPIPDQSSETLDAMVEKAIFLAKQDSADSEITYDFIYPPLSVAHVEERHARLRQIEEEIDKEVTRLYGLTEEDRLALKAELEGTVSDTNDDTEEGAAESGEEEDAVESAWTEPALARAWISYAFGTVLGRYAIGGIDALDRRGDPCGRPVDAQSPDGRIQNGGSCGGGTTWWAGPNGAPAKRAPTKRAPTRGAPTEWRGIYRCPRP